MAVNITTDEMNILNLNGITVDDVRNNVEYLRATGLDDNSIRKHYDNTLNTLRPITKVSANDGAKIKEYNAKGGITPYEYAKRETTSYDKTMNEKFMKEFDGTYDNIIKENNTTTKWSQGVDKRIAENSVKIAERNKRVNEGTASFLDRVGAALDRGSAQTYEVQKEMQLTPPELLRVPMPSKEDQQKKLDEKVKIGFGEAFTRGFFTGGWVPVVGGFMESADKQKQRDIQNRILKGEPIKQSELNFLNFMVDKQKEENIRGYTIGGAISKDYLNSLIRFGGEMMLGGYIFKSLGLGGIGTKAGGGITKGLQTLNVGEKAAQTAGKAGGIVTNAATFGALNTVLPTTYNDTYATYQNRRLDKSFVLTDEGKVYFKEADEKPATSFMKSLMQTYLMFTTEGTGELISMPVNALGSTIKNVATPLGKYLASNKQLTNLVQKTVPQLSKMYEKMNDLPVKGKNLDWLKSKVKYDGFIEEIGEEVLEDLLNLTFETGDEKRSLENYAKAVFKSPDEWAILVGAVALQGGTLSVASNILGNYMEQNGASDEEIIEAITNLKEEGTQEQVLKLIADGELTLSDKNLTDEQKAKQDEIKESIYSRLVSVGESDERAKSLAVQMSAFYGNLATENKDTEKIFNSIIDNLEFRYNVPADQREVVGFQSAAAAGANESDIEAAKQEWNEKGTGSKYFKNWFGDSKVVDDNGKPLVVYHGTNADFEKFEIGDIGYHFGNIEQATERMTDFTDGNPHIMTGYLKMENPLDIVSDVGDWLDVDTVKEYLHEYEVLSDEEFKKVNTLSQITSILQNKGYDGIIYENQFEGKGKSYIVFNSSQFKSVDNQGTFDANNPNIYYQAAAMYESPKKTFDEFFDQVQSNVNPKQKAYYTYTTDGGVDLDIFHDVVRHDNKKHSLSKTEWNELFEVIDNGIEDKLYANKSYYKGKPILLKIKSGDKYFGVSIEVFPKRTIITTAFKSTSKGVDTWIEKDKKKSAKTTAPNHQSRSSITQGNNVILGQTLNYIITHVKENFNPDVNKHEGADNKTKRFFQEIEDKSEEVNLIAGYNAQELMDKYTEIIDKIGELSEQDTAMSMLLAKQHVLEDAFEMSTKDLEKVDANKFNDLATDVYYVMNDQDLPKEFVEADKNSKKTFNELAKMHKERLEEQERSYRGYFEEDNEKSIITIMSNADASTALHELGHFYLMGLNRLAEKGEKAKKLLDAVNKWLGSANGEYTVSQQEKFARSFEAYLYKGKAPNNKLREVFTNFKDWLRNVYRHVTDIPNADISEEVQGLFDRIFAGDEVYEEKQKAENLLKEIRKRRRKKQLENIKVVDDKDLDETQKRHKEVAYDILSVATGKSKKYLKSIFETNSNKNGFGKKRENIEFLLDKVDDKLLSARDGMLPEWMEFYGNASASGSYDDSHGDYNLAEQAFYTIINKDYRKKTAAETDNDLDRKAEYYANEINAAENEYSSLIKEFKKGNRNVVLAAYYDWINSLDVEIREDFENRFIFDTAMIERDEKVDIYDRAKRNIIKKALEVENQYSLSSNEGYTEFVKGALKELNFLLPSDKAKLTANILDINSVGMLSGSLDNIMDLAKTMEDVRLRNELQKNIYKELQTTKNIKQNGRTVGKYNYKANKIFEELRRLDKLNSEKAQDELTHKLEMMASIEDNSIPDQERLFNMFLQYKAYGKTFADTELMKKIYDEILRIKLAGKSAKSEADILEKLNRNKDIDELIEIVQGKKKGNIIFKAYVNGMANLESTLNAIFNKGIREKYGAEILHAETQSQAWQYEQKTKFENEVAKIYDLPKWLWDKKILEYLSEKHTYQEYRRTYDAQHNVVKTRIIDRELSKMDIIAAYIWSKNDVLNKRLINQFGEEQLYTMFDEMSLQDVRLAELLMHTAQSFYPMVNKVFINKYGLDLPKVSCYFPSTPERTSEVDTFNEYSSQSLNRGFTKSRANAEAIPMDFHNPVAILYNHIDGVAKFAFMAEELDNANKIFKNNDLKRVIVNKYGDGAFKTLEQSLINVSYKKEAPVYNGINKLLNNMVSNWVVGNVAIKPIVGLKQLLSANNYALDMPYMKWQLGFLNALAHPKATIDYMMKIPYLKARFGGNFSNEFLQQTIQNSAFAASKKLKDSCTLFVKLGDIGAIIFGGKPYIDYLINEEKLTEEEAIKRFIISTNRSQQSSAISSLSNFQVAMSRSPVGALFIAFKNSPQQYVRMCGDAIISATNGDISKPQAMKMLFQFGFLQPFLYAAATSGSLFHLLFTGDDDDLLADLKHSIFNLGTDAIPLLGDIWQYILDRAVMKNKYTPRYTPLIGDIENEIAKLSKEDITLGEALNSIGYLGLHVGLGYNSKAIVNEFAGFGDIAKGDFAKGSMRVAGYTKKRAENIVK